MNDETIPPNSTTLVRGTAEDERFRVALAGSPVSVSSQDRQLHYTWGFNPASGRETDGLIGRHDAELLNEADARHLTALKQGVLDTGIPCRAELLMSSYGGGRTFDISIQPIRGADDAIIGVATTAFDITDRRQVEDAVRLAQEQSTQILDSIQDAFFALDNEWCFSYVNDRAAQMWNTAPGLLLGRCLWDLIPNAKTTRLYTEYTRAAREHQPVEFETFAPNLGYWVGINVYPGEAGVSVYFRDITLRKQAEAQSEARLRKQERIAESLQRSLLVTPPQTAFPGVHVHTRYEAASDEALVGGDFFDAFALGRHQVAFVVGDVVGKGLAAATYTAEVKFALRAYLHEWRDPARALIRLNNFMMDSRTVDREGGAIPLVAVAVALLDTRSGKLTTALAGAEPPLILRADGDTKPQFLHEGGTLIGVGYNELYPVGAYQMEPGDLLLFATDGITEARSMEWATYDFFGAEGMIQAAHETAKGAIAHVALPAVADAIIASARARSGGTLRDDACLLLARRPGAEVSAV